MAISFDGVTKIITLSAGTNELDVVDLYSRWKDWVALGNANFLEAFAPVGGDPIDALCDVRNRGDVREYLESLGNDFQPIENQRVSSDVYQRFPTHSNR